MSASKAKQAQVADRRAKAIAMYLAGADWQAIADALGYASRGAAHTDVTRALHANLQVEAEQVAEFRNVETLRLNRLQAAFWPKALKGDPKAAEVVLKCIAGRSKLNGVDAPVRTEVTGADGGPLAFQRVDAAELEALISATGRLDTNAPNTATRTTGLDDGDA